MSMLTQITVFKSNNLHSFNTHPLWSSIYLQNREAKQSSFAQTIMTSRSRSQAQNALQWQYSRHFARSTHTETVRNMQNALDRQPTTVHIWGRTIVFAQTQLSQISEDQHVLSRRVEHMPLYASDVTPKVHWYGPSLKNTKLLFTRQLPEQSLHSDHARWMIRSLCWTNKCTYRANTAESFDC